MTKLVNKCLMYARHSIGDLHRAETVTAQELTLGVLLMLLGEISNLFQRLLSAASVDEIRSEPF